MRVRPNDAERVYKEMAERYVEREGERLREELEQEPAVLTPRLDRRVRAHVRGSGAGNWIAGLAAAAAALLVVVGLLPRLLHGLDNAPSYSAGAPSVQSGVSAPTDSTDTLLPLTFTLPDNLREVSAQLDNGQSIYTLRDTARDDVVLVMERVETYEAPDGYTRLTVDGSPVYARCTRDYNLLTFCADGIAYTLSCRYELDTLLTLSRCIL